MIKIGVLTLEWCASGTGSGLPNGENCGSGPCFSVLPVELVAFDAVIQSNGDVSLGWTTATEYNSAYFMIERSVDGVSFEDLGRVAAAGNSNVETVYSFIDETLLTGVVYYRLHQVDLDGKSAYSDVRAVNITSSSESFSVWPNPSNGGALYLKGNTAVDQINVAVVGLNGQQVYARDHALNNENFVIEMEAADMMRGLYIVYVTNAQTQTIIHQTKLVIQ